MSNANAYLSVTVVSGCEEMLLVESSDRSWCRASSMVDATSAESDGAMRCFGGTTTVGPLEMDSRVASVELRRRKRPKGDATMLDIVELWDWRWPWKGYWESMGLDEARKKKGICSGGGDCSLYRHRDAGTLGDRQEPFKFKTAWKQWI